MLQRARLSSRFFLCVWILIFSIDVPPLEGQQLRYDRIGLDEGLSQVSPNTLLQDHRGFLWIGTQEGLNRWDGYDMLVIKQDADDPRSAQSSFILDLKEDREGGLWVIYQDVGRLDRYDPGSGNFVHFTADPADPTGFAMTPIQPGIFYQDKDGLVWMAQQTGNGLMKLDGESGEIFHVRPDPQDPAALVPGQVTAIYEDRLGTVWVATFQGLSRRTTQNPQQESFFNYSPQATAGATSFTSFYEDRAGTLWVGTWGRGLLRYDREQDRFLRAADAPGVRSPEAASVHADFIPPGGISGIPRFAEDTLGGLWVVQRSGIARWNAERDAWEEFLNDPADPNSLSNNGVIWVHADRLGTVRIGTGGGGLEIWKPETGGFRHSLTDPADPRSIGSNTAAAVLEDRSGLLWLGTPPNGLSRFSRQEHQFRTYLLSPTAPLGERENIAFGILEDRHGAIWMGTVESGLYRLDERRERVVERYAAFPGQPPSGGPQRNIGANFVRSLLELPDGNILVGVFGGGVYEIDPGPPGRVVRSFVPNPNDPESLSDVRVWGIDADREGNTWVTTANGWNRFDADRGKFKVYRNDPSDPTSLAINFTRVTYEDLRGNLWVAGQGLHLFDRETEAFQAFWHNPQNANSLSNNNVMVLWDDGDGFLWVGTYGGGINRIDLESGDFLHYRRGEGLPSDSVYSLLPDAQGYLWVATNHGLARFDRSNESFKTYDQSDGLPANEFNGRGWHRASDGELLFGTNKGLVGFYPEQIQSSEFIPPVVLTAFRKLDREVVFDRALDEIDLIELSYKDRLFSFEFAALDFTAPEKNRYAYRLEGFDEDWIESGSRRFAGYTNLDAGEYTFRVKASNPDGVWNEEGTSIHLRVIPPPWKTWWAYTLYILALAACIGGYARFKTLRHEEEVRGHREESERQRLLAERLQQIDQMKDEFLANTSHELRTPLNGIIGLTESMLDGAVGNLSEDARENLFMVASSGRRLAHLVDDILDFSKLKNHQIELRRRALGMKELVDIVLTLSAPLVAGKNVRLVNSVDETLPPVDGDENRLQQVLHNLVGNAAKFTSDGQVNISARVREDMMEVTVADTGIGIPPERVEQVFQSFEQADASTAREYGGTGLGLTITRQLVELHGGTIRAASQVGQGTRMVFTLPLRDGEETDPGLERRLSQVRDRSSAQLSEASPELPTSSIETIGAASADGQENRPGSLGSTPPIEQGEGEILIVDDEPVNLRVLENFLGLAGYAVRSAHDGPEALAMLDQKAPDLLLLDVMMPKMTGFEVTRRIRRKYSANALPIVLLTAKNQVSDLMEGLDSGANDYLTKPFSRNELMARIRTHLGLSRAHRREAENQRRVEELEQARAIQLSMLPRKAPDISWLEIATHMQTASEVGGDYYDFFPQQDGSLFLVVGDATGHGISAGMMVSMTKSALRALEVQSPHILLRQLNSVMKAVHLERMQMALNVTHFSETEVAFSSAAMPPAFLYRAATGEVEEILVPGLPLGGLSESTYQLRVFEFHRGDVLIFLSDGIAEVLDQEENQLGVDPLRTHIARHAGTSTPQGLIEHLVDLSREWAVGPPEDDITLVVVRRA